MSKKLTDEVGKLIKKGGGNKTAEQITQIFIANVRNLWVSF
jgi:hypothetical protein